MHGILPCDHELKHSTGMGCNSRWSRLHTCHDRLKGLTSNTRTCSSPRDAGLYLDVFPCAHMDARLLYRDVRHASYDHCLSLESYEDPFRLKSGTALKCEHFTRASPSSSEGFRLKLQNIPSDMCTAQHARLNTDQCLLPGWKLKSSHQLMSCIYSGDSFLQCADSCSQNVRR
jgi:hypothetical protein